jgi:hypothetical protein
MHILILTPALMKRRRMTTMMVMEKKRVSLRVVHVNRLAPINRR